MGHKGADFDSFGASVGLFRAVMNRGKKVYIALDREHNNASEKPIEVEDGVSWTIDECYVSYVCKYKGKDFCMITYEMIKTANNKVQTTNLVFLPPMGIRAFHLQTLLPYAITTSNVLANQIHNLWELLLVQYKTDKASVYLDVVPGTLVIED